MTTSQTTPTGLAADLPISRQAMTKHLAALAGASLVRSTRASRETRYELDPAALGEAAEWIAAVGATGVAASGGCGGWSNAGPRPAAPTRSTERRVRDAQGAKLDARRRV